MHKTDEILLILQEECAEVIQAVSKIKRFGEANNIDNLKMELADLQCMINLALKFGAVKFEIGEMQKRISDKELKLRKFSKIYE